jgi:hypothetical protein
MRAAAAEKKMQKKKKAVEVGGGVKADGGSHGEGATAGTDRQQTYAVNAKGGLGGLSDINSNAPLYGAFPPP